MRIRLSLAFAAVPVLLSLPAAALDPGAPGLIRLAQADAPACPEACPCPDNPDALCECPQITNDQGETVILCPDGTTVPLVETPAEETPPAPDLSTPPSMAPEGQPQAPEVTPQPPETTPPPQETPAAPGIGNVPPVTAPETPPELPQEPEIQAPVQEATPPQETPSPPQTPGLTLPPLNVPGAQPVEPTPPDLPQEPLTPAEPVTPAEPTTPELPQTPGLLPGLTVPPSATPTPPLEPEQPVESTPSVQPEEPALPPGDDTSPVEDSVVEDQLEAQGDNEEADRIRTLRDRLLEQMPLLGVTPQAPSPDVGAELPPTTPDGQPVEGQTGQPAQPEATPPQTPRPTFGFGIDIGGEAVERRGNRIILDFGGGNIAVQPVVPDEANRLLYGTHDVDVQPLPGGGTRTILYRDDGSLIITDRNQYGDIITRFRQLPDGRQIILIDNRYPPNYIPSAPPIINIPPPQVTIPQNQYVVDLGGASQQQLYQALTAPPVQPIPRPFTLDEILYNQQVRAYSPSVVLDTLTFAFGSATLGVDQMPSLFQLGRTLEAIIAQNPNEMFLVEGHTDKVGGDYDNLILSDRRAEALAVALSQNFLIPPENLITKGYGERFPIINTEQPERRNRRGTVVRITDLMFAQP